MGKSQKKRSMRRHNPVRVPDSHLPKGLESASSTSLKKEAVLPIIQKMESPDVTDRRWACVAVSNLIQNDPATRRLLQGRNVVGALITRLTDSEEEVVIEATGSLRNLCIDGGYDICAEMYNKNILTPLKSFIPKISNTLAQYLGTPKTAPENARKVVYEFADNVITVIWCLSETSNKALNAINQMNLVPFLMSFLASRDKLLISTVTSAAQCLYVLTDDNRPVAEELHANAAYLSCLLDIVQPESVVSNGKGKDVFEEKSSALRVLSSGILRNISPLPLPAIAATVDVDKDIVLPMLQPIISSVSLLELSNAVHSLASQQASEPDIEKLSIDNALKSGHKSAIELELERIESTLRTVQLALEILTGLCATLPDPEPDTPVGEDEDTDLIVEDDVIDDTTDIDMVDDVPVAGPTPPQSTFLPTLVQPLLALVQPTPLSFPPASGLSLHPPTTSVLGAIHISALECLNNIFLSVSASPNPTVSAEKDSGRKVWEDLWTALISVGTEIGPGQERRVEIWEIAVGVLWGIGNIWKGFIAPNEKQIKFLIQLCDLVSDPRTRVKCIGTLECLAQHPESVEGNRTISTYLLSILPTASDPSPAGTEPLIQALSALIDIYSDENMPYDVNFRQGHYLDRLSASVEGVKKAVRAIDRRKEGGLELRRRGNDMRENLIAFLQYRRDLRL